MINNIIDIKQINKISDYKISINPFTKILGYFMNEELVAFLDYSLIYDRIEINYIFVQEKFRNQKIAAKLIEHMMNQDYKNITLEVNIYNTYALKLYKSLGFRIVSIRENYYNGVDGYLMEVGK